ncbi:hypothetical protein WR25_09298 [Diploscapter pachys]|uniref:Uncharacterized protein n=1 Tax=Diploscapter pachys TaxID=2018661 RepID=A0A2A2L0W0_9BILA|nr:hypothetical protein WR25_09298 [Diploscapter pachys]
MDWYDSVSGPCLKLLVVTGDAKRFIGRQFNDSSVQNDMKRWRFKVIDRNGKPHVEFTQNRGARVRSAEQISSEVLKYMKKIAEATFALKNSMMKVELIPELFTQANSRCSDNGPGSIRSTSTSGNYGSRQVDLANDQDWKVDLSKAKFNEMIQSTIAGTLKIVDQALGRASLKTQDIDYVILAGGSTRIQLVREMLTEKFSKEKIWCKINPDEAVAIGASLIASSMQRDTPISLKLNIQEKTPLSLGVDYRHDYFAVVIPRGTVYPCKLDRVGGTSVDNQKEAEMMIYEGERKKASSNRKIGRVNLILENQNAKSSYKIKNIFEIDGNGILHVTTVEVDTGNSADLEIQYDGLSYKEDDIQRILAEAEAHKEEDADFESRLNSLKILEELLEQLNELKTMVQ